MADEILNPIPHPIHPQGTKFIRIPTFPSIVFSDPIPSTHAIRRLKFGSKQSPEPGVKKAKSHPSFLFSDCKGLLKENCFRYRSRNRKLLITSFCESKRPTAALKVESVPPSMNHSGSIENQIPIPSLYGIPAHPRSIPVTGAIVTQI